MPLGIIHLDNHWHKPERLKRCTMCGESKVISDFYSYGYTTKQGKSSTRYESRCRPCERARRRARHHADPARSATYSRAYRASRPGYTAQKAREYRATKHGKAVKARLQRLRKARLRSGEGDNAEIRAIYDEAMRIERLVAECPVFDLPELGHKMHVDHVIPLARGGRHTAENLQVLPIGLNMRKGASCPQ